MAPRAAETEDDADVFHDLHLDRVVAAITAGYQEYDLGGFFHARLDDLDAVVYRQEVMRDLEARPLRLAVGAFNRAMRNVRERLPKPDGSGYARERQRWRLDAAREYIAAVESLAAGLAEHDPVASGWRALRAWLEAYVASPGFRRLAEEAQRVAEALAEVRYGLLIAGDTVTVRPYGGEPDYSAEVERTFRKFRHREAPPEHSSVEGLAAMDHVHAQIVDRVAVLYPEPFAALAAFWAEHADFVDPTLARFDREVCFYTAYLGFVERLRVVGLPLCFPTVSHSKEVLARDAFDVALADELLHRNERVVCNDFHLVGNERALVVSGPNQGGKTTFARLVGQLHHFASLGCAVAAREARLLLCDRVLTQFEREEDVTTLHGKLEDDLLRMRRVLDRATNRSLVILNEVFASTSVGDALFLSREILVRLMERDALCVCVTFLDELATLSEKTVSMVAGVDPDDPLRRTFRLERRPPDGLAYAVALAEKHHVTRRWLLERLRG